MHQVYGRFTLFLNKTTYIRMSSEVEPVWQSKSLTNERNGTQTNQSEINFQMRINVNLTVMNKIIYNSVDILSNCYLKPVT